jgi:hypothetical protein
MVFEAIATRISVRGEAPAVYKEYMRITENHPTPQSNKKMVFRGAL